MPPVLDPQLKRVLAERIRTTVESCEFNYKEDVIPVRVSIGFAIAEPGVEIDYETMKHLAASALSEAKNTGRNKCVYKVAPKRPFERAGLAPASGKV